MDPGEHKRLESQVSNIKNRIEGNVVTFWPKGRFKYSGNKRPEVNPHTGTSSETPCKPEIIVPGSHEPAIIDLTNFYRNEIQGTWKINL